MPARYLRLCGDYFKDDRNFFDSARNEALRLIRQFEIRSRSVILDLGCGYGRLAIGLVEEYPDLERYIGIDVNADAIRWCTKYIHSHHANFEFIHTDIENSRYNPDGSLDSGHVELPLKDRVVDFVYLYSVFSHMLIDDVKAYLSEFNRILRRDGKVFLTAFVEENVEEMVENPEGYLRQRWNGPLHCVRYDKSYLEKVFEEQGFEITTFHYAEETHGQSSYVLKRSEL